MNNRRKLVIALCAGVLAAPLPSLAQQPMWQQKMDRARRMAADGIEQIIVNPPSGASNDAGSVVAFYNNPRPFCYTYMIPGEWIYKPKEDVYYSKDGRSIVGVGFWLPQRLEGVDGATLVEKALNNITKDYSIKNRRSLVGVEFIPFESAPPGTWQWRAGPIIDGAVRIEFPMKLVVDLSPDAIMEITIGRFADDAQLARQIIESLRTTKELECYLPILERKFRSESGER